MKKFLFSLGILGLVAGLGFSANFDNHTVNLVVSQIAALTMNIGGDITLTIDDAGGTLVGGATPPAVIDSTQYLQYTLINTGASPNRKIQVSASGAAPAGTSLTVEALGSGGAEGDAEPAVTVSGVAVDLIRSITNVATGIGATDGANLTYSFALDDIAAVVVATTPLLVTYTILDQ